MCASDEEQRAVFRTFVEAAISDGAEISFQVNGQDYDPLHSEEWPSAWRLVSLKMSKSPMLINGSEPAATEALAVLWSGRMLGSVLALLPLEPADETNTTGVAEGGAYKELVTKYERSHLNRAACVEIRGALCHVCGFDFERFYGAIGAGFIEIHHVESVSQLAPGSVLNPALDLVPLCANCHRMAHRRGPLPYSVEELKAMLQEAKATKHSMHPADRCDSRCLE
jgi:5-methylcytosine-specific restriction protein A